MLLFADYIKLTAAMLIWGSVGLFVRAAGQPAYFIVFMRVAGAFAALGAYRLLTRRKVRLLNKKWGLAAGLSGIILALNWILFFISIQKTTIGNATFAYCLAPVFSILWARLFLNERLEARSLPAFLLSGAGVALMLSAYEFSMASQDFAGILYGLAGAGLYSGVIIIVKLMPPFPPDLLVFLQTGAAALFFAPGLALGIPDLSWVSFTAMLALGLVHSALALGLYFSGLKSVKVQHASILAYLEPVSAALYAYFFLGETLSLPALAGGLLIMLSSLLIILPALKEGEVNKTHF